MTHHVLIINSVEAVTDDEPGLTIDFSYDIDIECPGVTDACAEWEECGVSGCPTFRGDETGDWDIRGEEIHGVVHRYLHEPGFWGVRSGFCYAQNHGHAVAEEVAERLKLVAGRYEVDLEFYDGDLVDFPLADEDADGAERGAEGDPSKDLQTAAEEK